MNPYLLGHLLAAGTMLVWGTTFIATKLLLTDFSPVEILFSRFTIGFVTLCILIPRRFALRSLRQELVFAMAGFLGITLYFLFENIAITYTTVSNAGVILGTVPFFIALVDRYLGSRQPLHPAFFAGFAAALLGICCLSMNTLQLEVNPLGDFLALLASITWAFYTMFVRKAAAFGCNMMQMTRRIFMYGLILMLPFMYLMDFQFKPDCYIKPLNLGNLLFLGLGASAICFFSWNFAVKAIGSAQAGPYLYAAPAVTVLAAWLILDEELSLRLIAGLLLTIAGLLISELPHLRAYIKQRRVRAQ